MKLFLLGATGSIGYQTLDIVRKSDGRFSVETIAANKSIDKVKLIIEEFHPKYVSVGIKEAVKELRTLYPNIEFGYGTTGLIKAATYGDLGEDLVVNAVVVFTVVANTVVVANVVTKLVSVLLVVLNSVVLLVLFRLELSVDPT